MVKKANIKVILAIFAILSLVLFSCESEESRLKKEQVRIEMEKARIPEEIRRLDDSIKAYNLLIKKHIEENKATGNENAYSFMRAAQAARGNNVELETKLDTLSFIRSRYILGLDSLKRHLGGLPK